MIEARRVTVYAGTTPIVVDVDLDVGAGEVVALVGPNGAGKSTLLGALAGDRRVARGLVLLGGRAIDTMSVTELARRRAVLPQRSSLAAAYTALEVVVLAHGGVTRALALTCLADVGLAGLADRSYATMSGGEQQRVQLARVLAQLRQCPGAVLLLDEPTSSLDPRHQGTVLALARRAAAEGHPVVVVLHDLTLAARACHRVVLLQAGRIVAAGTPASVLTPENLAAAYDTPFEVLEGAAGMVVTPAAPLVTPAAPLVTSAAPLDA